MCTSCLWATCVCPVIFEHVANNCADSHDEHTDELRTLRMWCHGYSSTESPSDPKWFLLRSRFRASFTSYASFRLRAPRLQVFDWR